MGLVIPAKAPNPETAIEDYRLPGTDNAPKGRHIEMDILNLMGPPAAGSLLAAVLAVDLLIATVCVLCVVFLTVWVVVYAGPLALGGCPARRNRLPVYAPLLCLAAWQILASLVMGAIRYVMEGFPPGALESANYIANTVINLLMIGAILFVAWRFFAGRLKGFGLDLRTVAGDFAAAIVNFIAVLPLVWLGVVIVDFVGKLVDPAFEIGVNEGLDALKQTPYPAMKVLMLTYLAVGVPVLEEFLFRGLIQSTARSYLNSPWPAILITSFVFALMHPVSHWPAIFVLSVAMGYSYERSGSLFRPVFIHIFFNATTVCATLLSN
ncbi:MAG: hypothetical protein DRP66_11835 [Planctomycetota bacterium]|nr:MAG: hypothetical protein DRP66_11835 [Planctomycetota bacterium]